MASSERVQKFFQSYLNHLWRDHPSYEIYNQSMNIRDGESYGDIGISKMNRTESFNLEGIVSFHVLHCYRKKNSRATKLRVT
jgi:hypothetical protein